MDAARNLSVAGMAEYVDRMGISRNANGCEEPHSAAPELWSFDGTEVDMAEGHEYIKGRQLWYLQSNARDMIAADQKIHARPMNAAARASNIKGLPPRRLGEEPVHSDEHLTSNGDEVPGLEGLEESPPRLIVMGPSGQTYSSTSMLFSLTVVQQPRKAAIYLVEWHWFDTFVLVTILCNCATMAWNSPLDPCCTPKADFLAAVEWLFLAVYTFELTSKVAASGFLVTSENQHAYLADPWCQLDFVVVSTAWLSVFFPTLGNFSVVRSIRALRPLRALKKLP